MATNSGCRNFLIVGTQRTGSQALYQALNLHPEVVCVGEVTHQVSYLLKLRAAEKALRGDLTTLIGNRPKDRRIVAARSPKEAGWLGIKILFRSSDKWLAHPRWAPALLLDRLDAHLAWLKSRPDIHVIHLIRRDSIDWLKSKYLSRTTGLMMKKEYPSEMKVTIPVVKAIRAVEAKAWVDGKLATIAATNSYHRVYYEDFLYDNRLILESCLRFLQCDISKLPEETHFNRRQSSKVASEYISNYNELDETLRLHGRRHFNA